MVTFYISIDIAHDNGLCLETVHMLTSYTSAVLCSLIASFIDVLSLMVQCQPCLFGDPLHRVIILWLFRLYCNGCVPSNLLALITVAVTDELPPLCILWSLLVPSVECVKVCIHLNMYNHK